LCRERGEEGCRDAGEGGAELIAHLLEDVALVRFDPKTEKFQTWAIPSGGGVVRNMMATKDGNLVLAESGVNKVALVEIVK
jgi:streptogramin lyase